MRHVRLVMSMLFAVLFAAACSDAPTAPDGIAVGAAGPSNTYTLDPLIVKGKCDPIMSIDWCGGSAPGDGDCMTSAGDSDLQHTSGCYTGGGTGPGAGGGSPGTGTPTPTPTTPTVDTSDDMIGSQERLPDCTNATTWTKDWHGPYCNGSAPTGTVLSAYNAELNAMLAKGGMCAELARFGQSLLSRGLVRYYTSSGSIARSWGGPGIGLIMDDSYIVNQPPYDHGFALAHELEHAYSGYAHPQDGSDRDANGVSRTPNDWCG